MNKILFAGNTVFMIAQSLERYFHYLLRTELRFWDDGIPVEPDRFGLIYVLNELSELEKCFTWIYRNKINPDKLRILGYDSNADINLLEVDTLKIQIEHSFLIVNRMDWSCIPFINDQVKLFFKGHGEQSLLGCIGWVNYYFGNYRAMAETRQYSPKELNEAFLIPGSQNWHEFMRRFSKYAPILYALGWDKQVIAIERFIKVIVLDINHIELSDALHTFDSETMNSLAGIITAIEEMAFQADQKYNETNLTDH